MGGPGEPDARPPPFRRHEPQRYVSGLGRSALRSGRTAGVGPSMSLAAATAELQAAKLAVQLRTLEIEKLKLPDRRAAADAIRPLFRATGPANRAARTAAR